MRSGFYYIPDFLK